MVHWVNPAAMIISDVIDDAKSEREALDLSSMNEADWDRLRRAAESLEFSSRRMAEARALRVGDHTAEVAGFANKDEIQARIDADPRWFRKLSLTMARDAHQLRMAAVARNPQLTRDLALKVNESCQTCHTHYWEKPTSHLP
jgi:hypothetical protein